jgi:hypothetical protein
LYLCEVAKTPLPIKEFIKENKYIDIDRSNLSKFCIYDGNKLVLTIVLERPTQKLICRKRTTIDLLGNVKGSVMLCGWHENIGGKSIKSICYIYSDGHIEMAGEKDDIQLLSQEKED